MVKDDVAQHLSHIVEPQLRAKLPNEDIPSQPPTTLLSLDLESKPNHLPHLLNPGRYRLTLLVAAANHPTLRKIVEVNVSGKWFPDMTDMLRDGITITLHD